MRRRMIRPLLAAGCVLLALPTWAQRKPPISPSECPAAPADCQINYQTFNFGRSEMSQEHPPIDGSTTISVTCTRAPRDNLDVTVTYDLKLRPPDPSRHMRNQIIDASDWSYLGYKMYVDPARTQHWGDGVTFGTFAFGGTLFLNDRNRVGTIPHVVYGTVDGRQPYIAPGNWLGMAAMQLTYEAVCTDTRGGLSRVPVPGRGGIHGVR